MTNPYYQPYWNPYQFNELEHYGILGMKWGKKKGKAITDFKNTKFGDVKLYETGSWLAANPLPTLDDVHASIKTAQENKVLQKGIASVSKTLAKNGKKTLKSLARKVIALGTKLIYKFRNRNKNSK